MSTKRGTTAKAKPKENADEVLAAVDEEELDVVEAVDCLEAEVEVEVDDVVDGFEEVGVVIVAS